MKIGIFHQPWNAEIGGGATFQDELFNALQEQAGTSRHTFICFTRSKDVSLQKMIESKGMLCVPIHRSVPEKPASKFRRRLQVHLKKMSRSFGKHGLEDTYHTSIEELLAYHGVDMVWHLHPEVVTFEVPFIITSWDLQHRVNPFFPEVSTRGQWETRENFYSIALRRAAVVIVGTNIGKAEVERFYQVPSERVKVLPFPTPGFALKPQGDNGHAVLAKYGLERRGYIFYPAQFWPHKNHVGLLNALRILHDKHKIFAKAVFVGSDKGNLKHVLKTVSDLRLAHAVSYLGFVEKEELIALYRNASAMTFVSYFGPDNLPPLEAFALGCPVIASRVPGAEEQLGDAAHMVDHGDPYDLAAAIKTLHENEGLREMLIQRGRSRALEFTCRDYVNKIFTIFDEFEPMRQCWTNSSTY